ncbi:MAG: UDP-N-acetylglucosamine 1-carboxyvinyltransferase, partial [Clostridia bacterium]|nr:UDP-N-acetylglucosamine 1-carboxyvinyltransferase [Clostridia bacterium]
ENLFENRFKYTVQLLKMGASITVRDRVAVVKGVKSLRGAEVLAQDLRGGASLVLAGLVANGETIVRGVEHIDRGYWHIEGALSSVGASVERKCE